MYIIWNVGTKRKREWITCFTILEEDYANMNCLQFI